MSYEILLFSSSLSIEETHFIYGRSKPNQVSLAHTRRTSVWAALVTQFTFCTWRYGRPPTIKARAYLYFIQIGYSSRSHLTEAGAAALNSP